jgi:hypothetical protein
MHYYNNADDHKGLDDGFLPVIINVSNKINRVRTESLRLLKLGGNEFQHVLESSFD